MQVSRDSAGGRALVVLAVDSAVSPQVAEQVRRAMDASTVRLVDLSG